MLKELVCSKLDLLVSPLGGPVLACDQAHPMDTSEVAIDERVPSLGVIRRTLGKPQVPRAVVVP